MGTRFLLHPEEEVRYIESVYHVHGSGSNYNLLESFAPSASARVGCWEKIRFVLSTKAPNKKR